MPAAHRLGDMCTGHGCYSPRPNIEGSPNVFVNGKPAHRVGDAWAVHCCGSSCHGGQAATGSPNVFVNGKPKCRIKDAVNCGSMMATGSPNVFVN
ncbi:PAAR domain-containing protein [Halomonas sp. AOP43-A1-21]